MAEDAPVLVPNTNCVCLEITLPEHFSTKADKLFVIPSHSREPLSHPPAQLNSESSWVSLTFFISRKSVWNWEELPIQLVESNCHFQQLGSFPVAAEPHSWAGRKAQLWRNLLLPPARGSLAGRQLGSQLSLRVGDTHVPITQLWDGDGLQHSIPQHSWNPRMCQQRQHQAPEQQHSVGDFGTARAS